MSQLLLPPPKPISNQRKNEKSVCSLKMLENKQPKLTKKRLRNFCELESRLGRVDRELEQTHCRRLLGAGRRATPQSSPSLKGGDQGGNSARSFGTISVSRLPWTSQSYRVGPQERQQYPGLEDAKPEHLGLDRPQVTSCYLHTCPKQKEASK